MVALATNQHGNHIINICLSRFPTEGIDFIVNAFVVNCKEVAAHKHGCIVVQKCFQKCNSQQLSRLAQSVIDNSLYLTQNQFGNYIVQNIIRMNIFEQNQLLFKVFAPHLIML